MENQLNFSNGRLSRPLLLEPASKGNFSYTWTLLLHRFIHQAPVKCFCVFVFSCFEHRVRSLVFVFCVLALALKTHSGGLMYSLMSGQGRVAVRRRMSLDVAMIVTQ